ncbi:phage tail protein [Amphritea sp.]|uniref:phage tail protein n=1 Tax=Amphritea sp. TaxID=1872502 RepID=UPI003D0F8172
MKYDLKTKIGTITLGTIMSLGAIAPNQAAAASDPLLGEIMLVGYNFCPRGWLAAEGQLLSISSNTALFSLYGTMYGGDGRTTFALPDLRGRAPIGAGSGPGLLNQTQGQKGGTESLTVGINNMPSHNHNIQATNAQANMGGPNNKLLAADSTIDKYVTYDSSMQIKTMASNMVTNTGGSQPISKRSPYLALKWCVATVGVYPSRN